MKRNLRPASVERRNNVLDAGMKLVLANGWYATTMEAIAREAGIAKPTLYKYFPDKTAIYVGVANRLIATLRALIQKQLGGKGTASERIAGALTAKHKAIFRLLEGSPHAAELYGAKGRFAPEEFAVFEKWLEEALVAELRIGGQDEPVKYAQLLIACSEGIARRARFAEQIGPAIRLVTEKLLA